MTTRRPKGTVCTHNTTNSGTCKLCRRAYHKAYARDNYNSDANKQKYLATRDAHKIRVINRRAQRLGVTGTLTLAHWLAIKGACHYCGLTEYPIEIDHTIPLSRGGSNTDDNTRAVCCFCNKAKAAFPENYFLGWLAQLKS